MTDPNVPQPPPEQADGKLAGDLAVGDRIAAGFLHHGRPAEVLFVRPYSERASFGRGWVLVVHEPEDNGPDVDFFFADKLIPVEFVADPDHGRTTAVAEAKPDTLVQPLGRAAVMGGPVCSHGYSVFRGNHPNGKPCDDGSAS